MLVWELKSSDSRYKADLTAAAGLVTTRGCPRELLLGEPMGSIALLLPINPQPSIVG